MNPITHFLAPFTIAFILERLGIWDFRFVLIAAIMGVLVDFDHYVEFVIHAKCWSFKEMWNNCYKTHQFYLRSFIHHKKGVIIVTIAKLIIAIFSWKIAMAMAIGYYSHIILDYIHVNKEEVYSWQILGYYIRETGFEIDLEILLISIIGFLFIGLYLGQFL